MLSFSPLSLFSLLFLSALSLQSNKQNRTVHFPFQYSSLISFQPNAVNRDSIRCQFQYINNQWERNKSHHTIHLDSFFIKCWHLNFWVPQHMLSLVIFDLRFTKHSPIGPTICVWAGFHIGGMWPKNVLSRMWITMYFKYYFIFMNNDDVLKRCKTVHLYWQWIRKSL